MSDTAPIEHPSWLTSGDFTVADETLFKRYSPHGEAPLSFVGSFATHFLVVVLLFVSASLAASETALFALVRMEHTREKLAGSVRDASWMYTDDGVWDVQGTRHVGKEAVKKSYMGTHERQKDGGLRHFGMGRHLAGSGQQPSRWQRTGCRYDGVLKNTRGTGGSQGDPPHRPLSPAGRGGKGEGSRATQTTVCA